MTENIKAKRSQKKGAKEILRLGEKALDYRRDILSADQVERLESATTALKVVLSNKIIYINELEEKAEKVDIELKESGGLYYHKKDGWKMLKCSWLRPLWLLGLEASSYSLL